MYQNIIFKNYESKRGGEGGRERAEWEGETEVEADSIPLRAAAILCEGTPGNQAI